DRFAPPASRGARIAREALERLSIGRQEQREGVQLARWRAHAERGARDRAAPGLRPLARRPRRPVRPVATGDCARRAAADTSPASRRSPQWILAFPVISGVSTRSASSTTVVTPTTLRAPLPSPSLTATGAMAATRPTKLFAGNARTSSTTG